MHGGDGDPEDYTTVTQQLTSFTNLSENLHNVIGQVSGDEFRNYSKRDRAGAALLTAGIKANIIEEIREEAKERNNESVGGKGDAWGSSMEGRMAKAAFVAMKRDMVGKGKGIKIIKHARNGTSRVVKLKLKKIPPMYDDDYSSGSEEEGEQKIKGVRHDGRKNVEQERKSLEQVKVEDEFADPNWDQDTLKHTKEVVEELGGEGSCVGGPFLSYRGGFWNKYVASAARKSKKRWKEGGTRCEWASSGRAKFPRFAPRVLAVCPQYSPFVAPLLANTVFSTGRRRRST